MPKAKKTDTTAATAAPPELLNEAWVRLLAPSIGTEEVWTDRDPVNKAMMAVSGATDRLSGLSQICWGLWFGETVQGGKQGMRHPYAYLAQTLSDIARGLAAADHLYRGEMDRVDKASLRAERKAAK